MKILVVMRDRGVKRKDEKHEIHILIILDDYTSHQDLWEAVRPFERNSLRNTNYAFDIKFIAFNLIMREDLLKCSETNGECDFNMQFLVRWNKFTNRRC